MSQSTNDKASVATYADHEIITPPNKLRKVVSAVSSSDPNDDPVARAEQALFELSGDFSRWMESECERLDAARHAAAGGFTEQTRDELFRAAHDIKGEAATFGFPLIEPVAASLCRLIEHSPDLARIPLMLIDQHVDGIVAIVHRNARGNTERKAQQLARRLSQVTEEFLVHENGHRPGYLEEVGRQMSDVR